MISNHFPLIFSMVKILNHPINSQPFVYGRLQVPGNSAFFHPGFFEAAKIHLTRIQTEFRVRTYCLGCPPSQDSSHHQDFVIFRIGNPNLNLHFHYYWEGGTTQPIAMICNVIFFHCFRLTSMTMTG